MEDYLVPQKLIVSALTPKNFSSWIQEIKGIATRAQVWEYVDPEGLESEPVAPKYPRFGDYIKIVPIVTPASIQETVTEGFPPVLVPVMCEDYDDLSEAQQKSYDAKERSYRALQQEAKMSSIGIQKVHTAILESARGYLAVNRKASPVREILISLASKFKRPDADLQLQIDEKYEELKASHPIKGQIESWVQQWEALREEMTYLNIDTSYNEHLFTTHFLKAARIWAPEFCDQWARAKKAANQPLTFFETTMEYRVGVDQHFKDTKPSRSQHSANAASFQGASPSASASNDKFSKNVCVCEEAHSWAKCPYLTPKARSSGWKADKDKREQIRQKIQSKSNLYWSIKKHCNFDILNELPVPNGPWQKKARGKASDSTNTPELPATTATEKDASYAFGNMAISADSSENLLRYSVSYGSGCSNHLTWDKSRFIDEIRPAYEWVKTPARDLLIERYATMLVKGKLNGKTRNLHFRSTAYVPTSQVTLVSVGKLKDEGAFWDMHTDTVKVKGVSIFELEEHFGLHTIEYHPVGHAAAYANFVGPRPVAIPKGTPWKFHLRLGHCQPDVITHLAKSGSIELPKGDASKTVKCETCKFAKYLPQTCVEKAVQPVDGNKSPKSVRMQGLSTSEG